MGLGRNGFWWSVAAVAASLPIPFITAGQRVLLYENVPLRMQGSVFGIRNALQFGTIPVGILLGGSESWRRRMAGRSNSAPGLPAWYASAASASEMRTGYQAT